MPAAYSKPRQTSNIMRHIEKPGIVTTVYSQVFSGIFRDIQQYSAMLRHIEGH